MPADARFTISATDRTRGAFASVNRSLGSLNRNIGATVVALGGLSAFGAVALFAREEQAIFQLEQRIRTTGGVAGRSAEQIRDLAASLQETTTFGNEATIEMANLLLTFTNIRTEVLDQAIPAVQDVATAMGTDLRSAALQVGKALNDPISGLGGLSRAGIQFTADQKAVIRELVETGRIAEAQKKILAEFATQMGGSAQAAARGFSGALKQLGNELGDVLENSISLVSNQGQGGLIRWMTDIARTINNEIIPAFDFWLVRLGIIQREVARMDQPQLLAQFDDITKSIDEMNRRAEGWAARRWSVPRGEQEALAALELQFLDIVDALDKIQSNQLKKAVDALNEAQGRGGRATGAAAVAPVDSIAASFGLGGGIDQAEQQLIVDQENARLQLRLEAMGTTERATRDHLEVLTNMEIGAANRRLEAIRAADAEANVSLRERTSDAMHFLEQRTRAVAQEERALFEINKIAGIAAIAADTPVAVAGAYKVGARLGGPVLGAAWAGITALAMAVQARAIANAKFGGGAAAPATAPGGNPTLNPPTAPPININPEVPAAPGAGQGSLHVHFHGFTPADEGALRRTVIPILQRDFAAGDLVLFSRDSAQGVELVDPD